MNMYIYIYIYIYVCIYSSTKCSNIGASICGMPILSPQSHGRRLSGDKCRGGGMACTGGMAPFSKGLPQGAPGRSVGEGVVLRHMMLHKTIWKAFFAWEHPWISVIQLCRCPF